MVPCAKKRKKAIPPRIGEKLLIPKFLKTNSYEIGYFLPVNAWAILKQ